MMPSPDLSDVPDLLTPAQIHALWKVDPKTVWAWANAGKLTAVRTPGGTRRYYRAEVEALLNGSETRRQVPGGGS